MKFPKLSLCAYYHRIRALLPCSWSQKNRIIADLQIGIGAYLADHPEANRAAIEEVFGTPSQIAQAAMDTFDTREFLIHLRSGRRVTSVVAGFMALIVSTWLIFCAADAVEAVPDCLATTTETLEIIDTQDAPEMNSNQTGIIYSEVTPCPDSGGTTTETLEIVSTETIPAQSKGE